MNLKSFFYRYSSFTLAKVGILVGRSAILILSFRWLTPIEFAGLAASLSFVEIARAFSELGAESIIYSRMSSSDRPISNIVKKLIRARFLLSLVFSLSLLFIFGFVLSSNSWPLFLLPLVGSIQNSNLAFMQKQRSYKRILFLVLSVLCISLVSVATAFIFKVKANALAFLMIAPEMFSMGLGFIFTNLSWKQVLHCSQKEGQVLGISRLMPYVSSSLAVSVIVILYSRLDVILVLPLLGLAAQADYSIGLRLVEPLFLIMSLASLALLAELGSHNTVNSRVISSKLMRSMNGTNYLLLFIFGFVLAFTVYWVAKETLGLSNSALMVSFFLVLAIPIKLCNTFFSTLLQRSGLYGAVMKAALITFFITFTIGLILGFYMGLNGVVFAAVGAEFFNFLYQKRIVNFMLKDNKLV